MKKNKIYMLLVLMLFSICVLFTGRPYSVKAANPQAVELKTNRTYKKYDITGDKKKDSIRIKLSRSNGYYYSLAVIVNGKTAYSVKNKLYRDVLDIRLYTLKNGKSFLYLRSPSEIGAGVLCGLFQYKSGKLKQVIDFHTLFRNYGNAFDGEVLSISGNTMTTRYMVLSNAFGPCEARYDYSYKNGTLKRTSNNGKFSGRFVGSGSVKRIYYANKKLTAYTSQKAKTRAFTVKKGASVWVDKCYCNGKSMLVRVKYNGKYGWIKVSNRSGQFSNVEYGAW